MENVGKMTTINMVIAPTEQIKHDFRRNLKPLIITFLIMILYILLSSIIISVFEDHWTFFKSLYFTVINTTTVGFGDIVPLSSIGKTVSCINAILGLIFFGIFVALITLAFRPESYSGSITQTTLEKSAEDENKSNLITKGFTALIELLSKNLKDMDEKSHGFNIRLRSDEDKSQPKNSRIDLYIDFYVWPRKETHNE
jgi:hypothetical protein